MYYYVLCFFQISFSIQTIIFIIVHLFPIVSNRNPKFNVPFVFYHCFSWFSCWFSLFCSYTITIMRNSNNCHDHDWCCSKEILVSHVNMFQAWNSFHSCSKFCFTQFTFKWLFSYIKVSSTSGCLWFLI